MGKSQLEQEFDERRAELFKKPSFEEQFKGKTQTSLPPEAPEGGGAIKTATGADILHPSGEIVNIFGEPDEANISTVEIPPTIGERRITAQLGSLGGTDPQEDLIVLDALDKRANVMAKIDAEIAQRRSKVNALRQNRNAVFDRVDALQKQNKKDEKSVFRLEGFRKTTGTTLSGRIRDVPRSQRSQYAQANELNRIIRARQEEIARLESGLPGIKSQLRSEANAVVEFTQGRDAAGVNFIDRAIAQIEADRDKERAKDTLSPNQITAKEITFNKESIRRKETALKTKVKQFDNLSRNERKGITLQAKDPENPTSLIPINPQGEQVEIKSKEGLDAWIAAVKLGNEINALREKQDRLQFLGMGIPPEQFASIRKLQDTLGVTAEQAKAIIEDELEAQRQEALQAKAAIEVEQQGQRGQRGRGGR